MITSDIETRLHIDEKSVVEWMRSAVRYYDVRARGAGVRFVVRQLTKTKSKCVGERPIITKA
jgi:hypothetical protein